eukprot:GHVO01057519.1.p1 GENE.GHVO01057519.1~~GHVO01057519.1.p1  ORF type:complete len:219 (+),score=19.92 GHVO01057519.1:747-1403(+)
MYHSRQRDAHLDKQPYAHVCMLGHLLYICVSVSYTIITMPFIIHHYHTPSLCTLSYTITMHFVIHHHYALYHTPSSMHCIIHHPNQYHNMPFLQYIWGGLKCMTGTTPENMHGCEEWGCCTYAPYAYGVYLVMNLAFNITLLALLKYGSALLGFVCMKAVLPISFILYAFIKWPLLDMSTEKPDTWKYISLAIVIVGTVWYRYASIQAAKGRRDYTYR